eukprot:scaffold27117_cov19-Tisochrysis_lutea.AAC.1
MAPSRARRSARGEVVSTYCSPTILFQEGRGTTGLRTGCPAWALIPRGWPRGALAPHVTQVLKLLLPANCAWNGLFNLSCAEKGAHT